MALSEHEQRLLEEMERSLYQNDADFVAPGSAKGRPNLAAITIGVIIALAGLGLVIAGVGAQIPLLGLAGFVVMIAGVLVAMRRAPETDGGDDSPRSHSTRPGPAKRQSFMSTLEDRWERRRDGR